MEREDLETMLADGLSLNQIGRRAQRHPATVAYWMRRYALTAVNRERHAARGGIDREALEAPSNCHAEVEAGSVKLPLKCAATVRGRLPPVA